MYRRPFYLSLALLLWFAGLFIQSQLTIIHAQSAPEATTAPTQESEPNNDFASANLMAIGAANPMAATATDKTDLDFFKFNATAGLPYTVEIFNVAKAVNDQEGAMQLFVYDSNLSEIGKDVDYDSNGAGNVVASVTFVPNTTGTYFLKIYPYYNGNGSGPYNVRVLPRYDQPEASWDSTQEPNNSATHAFKLTVGAANAFTSTMTAPNSAYLTDYDVKYDVDWFYFNAVADQVYVIETYNIAKAVNRDGGAMQLFVYDSNFSEIAKDDGYDSNGTGNRNASLVFTANTTGVYFIQLYPWYNNWGSGPYSIRILPKYDQPSAQWDGDYEPNNWAEHAPTLQVGALNAITTSMEGLDSSYLADYDVRYDTDWFRFDAVKGMSYVIETFNAAKAINPNNYALQLYVYDDNFSKLIEDSGSDSNGAGNTNATVEFVANTSGNHYILVQPYYYGADSGPYHIRILPRYDQSEAHWDANQEPNNWGTHAYPLEIGRTHAVQTSIEARDAAYLTDNNDVDTFRFEATAGHWYVVETFDVANAINRSGYAMQMAVYDKNGSKVAEDINADSNGAGNTNASVQFEATTGGNYTIVVYPYPTNGGSGPYQIRVLPMYNQPGASWDAAMEPNNWNRTAFPLAVDACGRLTSIEPRNSSFLTDAGDRDWFVFTVQQGKQYTFALVDDVSTIEGQFGDYGLEVLLYNKEFSQVKESLYNNAPELTFTADYNGVYYALVYPYDNNKNGFYRVKLVESLGSSCEGVSPLAAVEGNVSSGTNPDTGEVTIRGPRSGAQVTISTLARCPSGQPQNVTLWVGDQSYPMTHAEGDRYTATLTLPTGSGTMVMRATYTCGGVTVTNIIGNVVLIDPSGQITDKATGAPIAGAQVTLYHIANAQPDASGQAGDCRTTETRGGSDWSQLPAATLNSSERIDALAENISTSPQISPTINPQITGADGRYAWDVVPGCWYIAVSAPGYRAVTSPLVGIPPAVTDLNLQLEKQVGGNLYLPLVMK
ncbi:MAG: pre-peptidase C-terminal domain-containing protein [Caldilineaceae bacterium]